MWAHHLLSFTHLSIQTIQFWGIPHTRHLLFSPPIVGVIQYERVAGVGIIIVALPVVDPPSSLQALGLGQGSMLASDQPTCGTAPTSTPRTAEMCTPK